MNDNVAIYSVWMTPEEPDLTLLHKRIKEFASTHNTPSFAPHVTLIGDLAGDEAELILLLKKIATHFTNHTLKVAEIKAEDLFFKSLYLDLSSTPELNNQQMLLAQNLPASQAPREFLPHISMAYGPISPEIKAREAEALRDLVGTTLTFAHFQLVRSSQDIPIEEWEILQSFSFETSTTPIVAPATD